MIKKTIEISGYDTRLSLENKQVMVEHEGTLVGQFPAEDVGVLIVDTPTAVYHHNTIAELMRQEAVVVLCGDNHLPVGMILPCAANSIQAARLAEQVGAKLTLKKRLWRQLIQAKIRNQAANLSEGSYEQSKLLSLAERVRSGDPDNTEGQAARFYWRFWLGDEHEFHRSREGEPPNNFLNYGYMVIRAAIARAIVAAGFHPSIGLKHHNRYDSFCLADDLLEPFRPLVDWKARELFLFGLTDLNKDTKAELLSLLSHQVSIEGAQGPLMVELERMLASLADCFAGKADKLALPVVSCS
jgi:CRISPR-associated protein Cas1